MKLLQTLRLITSIVAMGFALPLVQAQTFTNLHNFTGANAKSLPYGGLLLSGSVLYGTTSGGGSGTGTVFKINPNGTSKSTLHEFSTFASGKTNSDGARPAASLILSGSTLYGTTTEGGTSGYGTIFKVNTDGTGFTTLYSFTGGDDGSNPTGSLLLSGSTLYGTSQGDDNGIFGAIFKINTNGTGFTTLYTFTDGADGAGPAGGLILSGSTLYGTASTGGQQEQNTQAGTIFKISTSGSGFTVIYHFTGQSDGANPYSTLVLSGSTLYGTAAAGGKIGGGTAGSGTVFKVSTSGSGFTTLYSFSALTYNSPTGGFPSYTNNDGANPMAGLVLSGSTLYGTASIGGTAGNGTAFKVSTSGSGFTNLHTFSALAGGLTNSDGALPYSGVVLSSSTLYGIAVEGGSGGTGAMFSLSTSGSSFTDFHDFSGGTGGSAPRTTLILSGSTFYGTTYGSDDQGTVFKVNTDGSGFTTLHTFSPLTFNTFTNSDGSNPDGGLVLSGSTLYGTASLGGSSGQGTVFKINTDGSGFAVLYNFTGGNDGGEPAGGLGLSGSSLYGTTESTVFTINTNGSSFTTLHTFSGSDGASSGGLILSGSILYGTTEATVYTLNTNGSGFTTLHTFSPLDNGENSDGASPVGGLILSGSTLYGTAQAGGANGNGTVFSLGTSGSSFTVLYTFSALTYNSSINAYTNSDGAAPSGALTLSGSTLYGTADMGGTNATGTVFSLSTSGNSFTTLHAFNLLGEGINSDGANPEAGLILSSGTIYGTGSTGGTLGDGTMFSLIP